MKISIQKKQNICKNLHFLPTITPLSRHQSPLKQLPTLQPTHIQSIIQKKNNHQSIHQINSSLEKNKKHVSGHHQLYSRYQGLPKIFWEKSIKERIKETGQVMDEKENNLDATGQNEQQMSSLKQSSIFDKFFYKQHFKGRFQKEVTNMDFKLTFHYQPKGMSLTSQVDNEETREESHLKYTKVHLPGENVPIDELQRVPAFLMEVLNHSKNRVIQQEECI